MSGHILWVMVLVLASLETIFHLVTICDLAWDKVEDTMQESGVSKPETMHPQDFLYYE